MIHDRVLYGTHTYVADQAKESRYNPVALGKSRETAGEGLHAQSSCDLVVENLSITYRNFV
jgi:hypothetical protein